MPLLQERIAELRSKNLGATEISKILGIHITTYYYHTSEKRKRQCIDRLLALKKDNKIQALEYKGGKCQKCGYNKCSGALVFHHKDPALKELIVAGRAHAWLKLKEELDKTVLLCCRCHTELHEGVWTKDELDDLGLIFIPNGVNTGRGILPPSKRKRS